MNLLDDAVRAGFWNVPKPLSLLVKPFKRSARADDRLGKVFAGIWSEDFLRIAEKIHRICAAAGLHQIPCTSDQPSYICGRAGFHQRGAGAKSCDFKRRFRPEALCGREQSLARKPSEAQSCLHQGRARFHIKNRKRSFDHGQRLFDDVGNEPVLTQALHRTVGSLFRPLARQVDGLARVMLGIPCVPIPAKIAGDRIDVSWIFFYPRDRIPQRLIQAGWHVPSMLGIHGCLSRLAN